MEKINNLGAASLPDVKKVQKFHEKELDYLYYNCTECPSLIEIISINENNNNIRFKCEKDHNKKLLIKEYLKQMEKNKNININEKCNMHNKKNICYCFSCIRHLCKKCLESKNHIKHKKIYIFELKPDNNDLIKMKNKIENYSKEIENIRKAKIKQFENILNKNIKKEKNKLNNINKINNKKQINELKGNKTKFINDINAIKKKYEIEIKTKKIKYLKENENIRNKYKEINNREKIIYNHKIDLLNIKKDISIKNLIYDIQIQNILNI